MSWTANTRFAVVRATARQRSRLQGKATQNRERRADGKNINRALLLGAREANTALPPARLSAKPLFSEIVNPL
jgi:hypothetical protein